MLSEAVVVSVPLWCLTGIGFTLLLTRTPVGCGKQKLKQDLATMEAWNLDAADDNDKSQTDESLRKRDKLGKHSNQFRPPTNDEREWLRIFETNRRGVEDIIFLPSNLSFPINPRERLIQRGARGLIGL